MTSFATLNRVADVLLDIRHDISQLGDRSLSASVDLALILVGRRLAARLGRDEALAVLGDIRPRGRKLEAPGGRLRPGSAARRRRR